MVFEKRKLYVIYYMENESQWRVNIVKLWEKAVFHLVLFFHTEILLLWLLPGFCFNSSTIVLRKRKFSLKHVWFWYWMSPWKWITWLLPSKIWLPGNLSYQQPLTIKSRLTLTSIINFNYVLVFNSYFFLLSKYVYNSLRFFPLKVMEMIFHLMPFSFSGRVLRKKF